MAILASSSGAQDGMSRGTSGSQHWIVCIRVSEFCVLYGAFPWFLEVWNDIMKGRGDCCCNLHFSQMNSGAGCMLFL